MFSFLGFFLIFLLVTVLLVLSFVSKILQVLFGLGRRRTSSSSRQSHGNTKSSDGKAEPSYPRPKKNKKIFDKSDGEYVDFEEIEEKKQ